MSKASIEDFIEYIYYKNINENKRKKKIEYTEKELKEFFFSE